LKINLNNITQNIINRVSAGKQVKAEEQNVQKQTVQQTFNTDTQFKPVDIKINNISNAQMHLFIKDLLQLPREWPDLLKIMFSDSQQHGSASLRQLLTLNNNANIAVLQELLHKNSKDVIDKLCKLSTNNVIEPKLFDQMSEILAVANSIVSNAGITPKETIKEMLQLYLPYLPLNVQENRSSNIAQYFEDKKGEKDESISIFISTENLGIFKLALELIAINKIELYIEHKNNNDNSAILKELINKLNNQLNEKGLSTNISYKFNSLDKNLINKEQKFYINQLNATTPSLLMTLFIFLNELFATDRKISMVND